MRAIQVRYLPPTDHRRPRWRAWIKGLSINRPRDYDLEAFEDARNVAEELANRLGWLDDDRYLEGGTLPNEDYCFLVLRS